MQIEQFIFNFNGDLCTWNIAESCDYDQKFKGQLVEMSNILNVEKNELKTLTLKFPKNT